MKKRIRLGVCFCAAVLCAAGCKKSDNYRILEASRDQTLPIYESDDEELDGEKNALKTLKDVYTSGYEAEEWKVAGVAEPAGILCRQEDILIVDRASHSVTAADGSGKVLQKIGREGSGAGEFRNPTAISEYGGNVYVLDGGNQRVQIFDENMDYVDEIGLRDVKLSDPNYVPGMLAVNASGVYVAGLSSERFVADRYGQNGREEIGNNFLGTICSYQEQIYLINSLVRTYDKKSDSFGAVSSGPEWLFTAERPELVEQCSLPQGLFITDFVAEDGGITCISASGYSVFRIGWNGEYQETVARIDGLLDEEYPKISVNSQGDYFIAMPETGKIFRCHKGAE
jgi:hypothetical protein